MVAGSYMTTLAVWELSYKVVLQKIDITKKSLSLAVSHSVSVQLV